MPAVNISGTLMNEAYRGRTGRGDNPPTLFDDDSGYVIWSNQHRAWWAPAQRGYTPYLEEAGRYDLAAARIIVADATINGSLTHRVDGMHGGELSIVDEVMLLAPEHTLMAEG